MLFRSRLFDCNIEITAQPPGKKLQNINLMSGGEKTMTAIALMWLLSSTTTWRPDSAIANHFKLWKLLKKRGYSLSSELTQEISVKSHDVVKFFGAAKLKESELEIGLKILSVEKMSFLILLPNVRNADLHGYVDKRWESANEHDYSFWTAVIAHTCCNRGVFLRVFGWFDDREVGVTSVMPRHLFESVFL